MPGLAAKSGLPAFLYSFNLNHDGGSFYNTLLELYPDSGLVAGTELENNPWFYVDKVYIGMWDSLTDPNSMIINEQDATGKNIAFINLFPQKYYNQDEPSPSQQFESGHLIDEPLFNDMNDFCTFNPTTLLSCNLNPLPID